MDKHLTFLYTAKYKILVSFILFISSGYFFDVQPKGPIIGNPPVYHYTHKNFNSDAQFWAACQDSQGVMYFGNNYGMLSFDGERWDKISLPNSSSVRSLLSSSDGTVYAGGFNEFGTITRNKNGAFSFNSLLEILPAKYSDFESVWQILEINQTIIFRTFNFLFLISDNNVEIIEASDSFHFADTAKNHLFVLDDNTLFTLDVESSRFTPIISLQNLNNEGILKIFSNPTDDYFFLITKEGSLFKFNITTKVVEKVQDLAPAGESINYTSALISKSAKIYTGTLSHKLSSWKLKNNKLVKIRSFPNLQDQTVLNLFESKEGTIWTMLNRGLDYFDPNAHLTTIFQGSSVYDALIFKNQLYIATNQGVFRSNYTSTDSTLNQNEFMKLPLMNGQAWSLKIINKQLYCSHDKGLYRISENNVTKIPEFSGVWKLYPVSGDTDRYFVCTYNGLGVIETSNDEVNILHANLPGFNESTRDLINDPAHNNTYWICHGYKGVFRIKINENNSRVVSSEHFNEQNGLPSVLNINVHRWNSKNVFSTNHGLFSFVEKSGQFVKHEKLNNLLGSDRNIRQIIEHENTTWFVIDDQIGYFKSEMKELIINPFLSLKGTLNRGLECIVPLTTYNEVLIGTTTGLLAFHPNAVSQLDSGLVGTHISRITYSFNDSIHSQFIRDTAQHLTFPDKVFNINFLLSAPLIRDKDNIRYSFLLENHMNNWSKWQEEPNVSFSFLKSGEYTLRVKAKSLSGEKAIPTSIYFSIKPAWYATWPWIIFWSLVSLAVIIAFIRWIQIIILREKDKTRREEQKQQKVLKMERENQLIIREKERIEADIIEKSKDLANNAMLIATKRELLIDVQDRLNNIRKHAKNDFVRSNILNIVRNIELNLNDEQQYQLFDTNLERIHQELFEELKFRYPTITAKELRMCAFVKMELTNKEMASIFNISVRGVETARYRLKKKFLNIDDLIGYS